VTAGGLHGLVVGTEKDVITLEIAALKGEKLRVKVDRARIDRRLESAGEKPDEKGES
jgi:preprotein translocase subunit YajC